MRALFDAGIWPITMATTVLKPGGYQRFSQIGQALADISYEPWEGVDAAGAAALAEGISADGHYQKPMKPIPSRKLDKKVPLIDCFSGPCRSGCPIEQDIPAYLMKVGEGKYEEALRIITQRNALPFITGTICSHRCQDKCMRNAYDESVYIRAQKLKAAEGGFEALLPEAAPRRPRRGPEGGRGGRRPRRHVRRLLPEPLRRGRHRLRAPGRPGRHRAPCHPWVPHPRRGHRQRRAPHGGHGGKGGAQHRGEERTGALRPGLHPCDPQPRRVAERAPGLGSEEHNVIEFLEAAKKAPDTLNLGRHVVVIGGGNTAMDAARAAKRLPGVETVSLVYRRTRRYMPADQEELELALADGVEFRELLAPVGVRDGVLTCRVMELGAPDATGRRSPVDTGRTAEVPADTVITAVGEKVDTELYTANGLSVDQRGRAVVNPDTLESSVKHVFVVGDGQKGPGTVVEAIAGAAKAAQAIHPFDADAWVEQNVNPDYQKPLAKRGDVCTDCASYEDSRCLGCATVCETCTEVCPNRANVAVWVPGMRQRQIIHVDGMCNECGNCATFCPYGSRPYQDKFTLFWSADDFENSRNEGFLRLEDGRTRVRLGGQVADYDVSDAACGLYDPLRRLICAVYENYAYLLG